MAVFIFSAQFLFATDVVIRRDDDPSPTPTPAQGPTLMLPVSATVDESTLGVYFDWSVGDAGITVYDSQNRVVLQQVVDTYFTTAVYIPIDGWEKGNYNIKINYGTTHLTGEFVL